ENKSEAKEVISITNDELYLLSKLVSSEARGEEYEGQVAVAAVVINRVLDSRFPGNIKDVIYQRNAFSVVDNGEIYKEPTDSAYKAAREALYGNDPTSGAIYFWNPKISTCNWIKKLDPYKRIGNHVFAK
ncbi:spore cortex-lytic protein, partial [Paraclostridium benzoelyticum]